MREIPVKFFESLSYLTGVIAAKPRPVKYERDIHFRYIQVTSALQWWKIGK